MNRQAPVTLNAEFTLNNSFDAPDQEMAIQPIWIHIEAQRTAVRNAYAKYKRDEQKPD